MRKPPPSPVYGKRDDPTRTFDATHAEQESVDRFDTARDVLGRMNTGGTPGEGPESSTIRILGSEPPEGHRPAKAKRAKTAKGKQRQGAARGARAGNKASTRRKTTPVEPPDPDSVVRIRSNQHTERVSLAGAGPEPSSTRRQPLDPEALAAAGDALRSAREGAGWSLERVSAESGLSTHHIEMLESGRPPSLAPVYLVGQLRSLARLYGLDEDEVAPLPSPPVPQPGETTTEHVEAGDPATPAPGPERAETAEQAPAAASVDPGALWRSLRDTGSAVARRAPAAARPAAIAAAALALLVVAVLVTGPGDSSDEVADTGEAPAAPAAPTTAPPATEREPDAGAEAETEPALAELAPVSLEGPIASYVVPGPAFELTIVASDRCWVDVVDASGERLIQRTLEAGDTETIAVEGEVSIRLGYTPGVSVTVDGTPMQLPAGETTTDLSVTALA